MSCGYFGTAVCCCWPNALGSLSLDSPGHVDAALFYEEFTGLFHLKLHDRDKMKTLVPLVRVAGVIPADTYIGTSTCVAVILSSI